DRRLQPSSSVEDDEPPEDRSGRRRGHRAHPADVPTLNESAPLRPGLPAPGRASGRRRHEAGSFITRRSLKTASVPDWYTMNPTRPRTSAGARAEPTDCPFRPVRIVVPRIPPASRLSAPEPWGPTPSLFHS